MSTSLNQNTEALEALLEEVNGLSETASKGYVNTAKEEAKAYTDAQVKKAAPRQRYGNLIVFGDSVGSGHGNDDYSFVDTLRESGAFASVTKACISGAAVGPYKDGDLNSQIETYATEVSNADIIILEYGANDVWSMQAGSVEMGTSSDSADTATICGYTRKAIARIYELNPDVELHWLCMLPTDFEAMIAAGQTVHNADSYLLFTATALEVAHNGGCNVLYHKWADGDFTSDGSHPNTAGHKRIAEMLLENLYSDHYRKPASRTVTLDLTKKTANGSFGNLYQLAMAGVQLKGRAKHSAAYLDFDCRFLLDYGTGYLEFVCMTGYYGRGCDVITVRLYADDTVKVSTHRLNSYVHNLLDNSDFTNPVNQRRFVSGSEVSPYTYFLDRWINGSGAAQYPTVDSSGIGNINGDINQRVDLSAFVGKKVTLVLYSDYDTLIGIASGTVTNNASWTVIAATPNWECYLFSNETDDWRVSFKVPCKYIALYEGEYTAETVPKYQPKGYGAELVVCQQYYQEHAMYIDTTGRFVPMPVSMHANPNAEFTILSGNGTPSATVYYPFAVMVKCASGNATGLVKLTVNY